MKAELITILKEVFEDRRLDVLTVIQVGTDNEELDQACIELRDNIVDGRDLSAPYELTVWDFV